MQEDTATWVLQQEEQPIGGYPARILIIFGGIVGMISTGLPWLSVPPPWPGGLSLWQLYSLGSRIIGLVDAGGGPRLVFTGILLWGVAVLVLGLGAIIWGAFAWSAREVRVAAAVPGGLLLAMGIASVLATTSGSDDSVGVGAGAILLVVAGVLTLSGLLLRSPRGEGESQAAHWHAELLRAWRGDVLGRIVTVLGVVCLVAALALFAAAGARASDERTGVALPVSGAQYGVTPSAGSGYGQGLPRTPSEGAESPESSQEAQSPQQTESSRVESAAEPESSSPSDVVLDYYDAINSADYATAWSLGGHNLGNSYSAFVDGYATTASVDWTTVSTSGHRVSGFLIAEHTDGTQLRFEGSYIVREGEIVSADIERIY